MIHDRRVFTVKEVETAEELANRLTQQQWCLCNGFYHSGHLYLNDSFSEDSAQEFAVIEIEGKPIAGKVTGRQVDSITFGWCNEQRALKHIQAINAGNYDGMNLTVTVNLDGPGHKCRLCA